MHYCQKKTYRRSISFLHTILNPLQRRNNFCCLPKCWEFWFQDLHRCALCFPTTRVKSCPRRRFFNRQRSEFILPDFLESFNKTCRSSTKRADHQQNLQIVNKTCRSSTKLADYQQKHTVYEKWWTAPQVHLQPGAGEDPPSQSELPTEEADWSANLSNINFTIIQ